MKKENFFEKKKTTGTFAIIAMVFGFIFLEHNLTGNMILEKNYYINFVSLIGVLLVICSLVLAIYSLRKK